MSERRLTHVDADGNATMVDVGDKSVTRREARARAVVTMQPETLAMIEAGEHKKGDVFTVAKVAGIQAAKQCSQLIPLCHPLSLSRIDVELEIDRDHQQVVVTTVCRVEAKTGVEMEALTAASVAALTVYDMCKAVDRGMTIGEIQVLSKSGGQSGDWQRDS